MVPNISNERKLQQQLHDNAFHPLCLNHSFLSYILAPGAHRERLSDSSRLALLDNAVGFVEDMLRTEDMTDTQAEERQKALMHHVGELQSSTEGQAPLMS